MSEDTQLTPTRPYMTRAFYEWLEDNELTPHLMVDATHNNAQIPTEYVQDGRIVLNVASKATGGMQMTNDYINFHARFGGISQEIWVPFQAVIGIYAKEDHTQGLFFDPKEYDNYTPAETSKPQQKTDEPKRPRPKRENKAGLKIL